jgi:alpha-tubulin suppressor-like RCC1 family protein
MWGHNFDEKELIGSKIKYESNNKTYVIDFEPVEIKLVEPVKQISLQRKFIIVLTTSGKVYTWGNHPKIHSVLKLEDKGYKELYSQPHLIKLPRPAIFVSSGENIVSVIDDQGKLYIWGKITYLLKIKENKEINQLSESDEFSLALTDDGILNFIGRFQF